MPDDLDVLEAFGIPVRKLAKMIRAVQALNSDEDLASVSSPSSPAPRRGRPPAASAGASPRATGGRAPRGAFNPSKEELKALRDQGMTGKLIAQKYGVSMATVNNRLREHGLTSGKRGRPKRS